MRKMDSLYMWPLISPKWLGQSLWFDNINMEVWLAFTSVLPNLHEIEQLLCNFSEMLSIEHQFSSNGTHSQCLAVYHVYCVVYCSHDCCRNATRTPVHVTPSPSICMCGDGNTTAYHLEIKLETGFTVCSVRTNQPCCNHPNAGKSAMTKYTVFC